MAALLEYLDLTALLEYIDLLNRYSGALHGASWGPFQAGARGKMPQLPPPVGGPASSLGTLHTTDHKNYLITLKFGTIQCQS